LEQAMSHILDRPIWSALSTSHADLAIGDQRAKRYPATIVPFAATGDDSDDSQRALAALVGPDETIVVLQLDDVVVPPGLALVSRAAGVQMLYAGAPLQVADARVQRLGPDDAAEMLALAELTRPGPFSLRAQRLGTFWGVKIDGRLVAMAGERLRQPGLAELSGVCAHPDVQREGYGRLLSAFVTAQILARGETPYLHAYASNTGAIRLYESIGFTLRAEVNVAVLRRA
jgi:predicted GNAT family acetyltransferase